MELKYGTGIVSVAIANTDNINKLSHGDEKYWAPFSALYLELVTMKKCTDPQKCWHKKMPTQKDENYEMKDVICLTLWFQS